MSHLITHFLILSVPFGLQLAEEERNDTILWVIVTLFLVILALLLIWWLGGQIGSGGGHDDHHPADDHDHAAAAPAQAAAIPPAPAGVAMGSAAAAAVTEAVAVDETTTAATADTQETPTATTPSGEPDDLKIVEGIGPKIESILQAAGIRTYAELANASVESLEKIVKEDAGIRVAFPATWPEQAALAAAGKFDELEKLKDELNRGRR